MADNLGFFAEVGVFVGVSVIYCDFPKCSYNSFTIYCNAYFFSPFQILDPKFH